MRSALLSRVRFPSIHRLINGTIAQGYNHAVSTGIQLITVPLLLHSWGADGYGTWVTLSALATYLTLADFGFGTIAAFEMGMALGAGNRARAIAIFQSVMALVGISGLSVLVVLGTLVLTVPFAAALQLDNVPLTTVRAVTLILSTHIFVSSIFNLLCGGMRATGSFSLTMYLTGTSRLVEQATVLVVAATNGGLIAASAGMLVVRAAFTLAASLILWRLCPWMRFGFGNANLATIRRLFFPAVTYMFYVLGNLLSIQGVSLVVAALFGPATVASFSAMRTLARLGPTSTGVISNTLEPEYALAFGAGQTDRYRGLIKLHVLLTVALCISYCLAMLSLSSWIFHTWTADKVQLIEPLMTLMIIACAGEMVWSSAQTPLVSTSRHKLGLSLYLVASAGSVAVMGVAAKQFGISAIGAVSVAVSFLMIVVTMTRLYQVSATKPIG